MTATTTGSPLILTTHELLFLITAGAGPGADLTRRALPLPDDEPLVALLEAGLSSLLVRGLITEDGAGGLTPSGAAAVIGHTLSAAQITVRIGVADDEAADGMVLVAADEFVIALTPRRWATYHVDLIDPDVGLGDAVAATVEDFCAKNQPAGVVIEAQGRATTSGAVRVTPIGAYQVLTSRQPDTWVAATPEQAVASARALVEAAR